VPAARAFRRMHIEQGPILEAEGKTSRRPQRQGIIWYVGASPLRQPCRHHADGSARCARHFAKWCWRWRSPANWDRSSRHGRRSRNRKRFGNVVPGDITLHPRRVAPAPPPSTNSTSCRKVFDEIAARRKVALNEPVWARSAQFDAKLVDAVERPPGSGLWLPPLTSGARARCLQLATVMPSAMISCVQGRRQPQRMERRAGRFRRGATCGCTPCGLAASRTRNNAAPYLGTATKGAIMSECRNCCSERVYVVSNSGNE